MKTILQKKKRAAVLIAGSWLALSACTETVTKQPAAARPVEPEWISLSDGSPVWHTYGKAQMGTAWKIDSNTVRLYPREKEGWQTKNGGDIVTNEEFENFRLQLEWKIAEGGNSGIMFYVHEDTARYDYPWQSGPELQVCDNEKNEDGKVPKAHAGDLYDLASATRDVIRPAGEWNQVDLLADRGKLEVTINGTKVHAIDLWSEEWKKMIAQSTFKNTAGFGFYKKGRIGLQDHAADVWYRNIRIKKL